MEIFYDTEECPPPGPGAVVTIGAYDGVHLGHRAVIAEVMDLARERGEISTVVTFDRHPAQVIRPDSAPRLLTDLAQKLELLEATGIDRVFVVHFDTARAAESAEDFVRSVLVDCLDTHQIVVGEDFHFGHLRRGNVALLEEMGAELGFSVHGHKLVGPDGLAARDDAQVSSTAIRRAIHEGRTADANHMLGRPHEMRGVVVPGDQRGRTMGFPTANVAVQTEMLMPADGIYAGWIQALPALPTDPVLPTDPAVPTALTNLAVLESEGPAGSGTGAADGSLAKPWPAAIYVGKRPTFYDSEAMTLLEVNILDFDGDVYGQRVAVRFTDRIRPDFKFTSVEDLIAQLQADCDRARELLGGPRY
ncbi:MAG: bifunctional riboflavin kinase/FAD synthetase [Microthrixaceae bacterium]